MDACDTGLCVLRVRFDDYDKGLIEQGQLSINVREQLSTTVAVLFWGPTWTTTSSTHALTHVRLWIDNASAVSWCNNLHSRSSLSQEVNRVLGTAEAEYGLRILASHLAESVNYLGSRAWSGPKLVQWNHLTRSWSQVGFSTGLKKLYKGTCSPFSDAPSPIHRSGSTSPLGASGVPSAFTSVDPGGYHATTKLPSLTSWSSSLFTAGQRRIQPDLSPPYMLSSAIFDGTIAPTPDSSQGLRQDMPLRSQECLKSAVRQHPRAPVSFAMLEWILRQTNFNNPSQHLILGAALLGFFFALRSSEYPSER